ncbi:MAG: 16S rRNA (cytosine(1402)-N(4))-methyltransferase RsmH [Patescibacteria group bacterium]|jgi:16S rRNA (cytosine1402-N4)-methyltransferase
MNHTPVLLNEVLNIFSYLNARDGYFVDGTLGAGGHSIAIAKQMLGRRSKAKVIGIDKDSSALELAKKNIENAGLSSLFTFVHDDFWNIRQILSSLDIDKIEGALIDLGVSSMQLDQPERGFTFQDESAPLDMRMDQSQSRDAAYIVNNYTHGELEKLFSEIGEERYARSIAKNITTSRKNNQIQNVGDLLAIIKLSVPPKVRFGSKKHFATNVFRALRIEVNEELTHLDKAVEEYVDLMTPGARLAIITFHSSEDRIIKEVFRRLDNPCICPPDMPTCGCGRKPTVSLLKKKPIEPSEEEVRENPRSRSSKMRVIEKL